MPPRRRKTAPPPPRHDPAAGWIFTTDYVAPSGRHLRPGVEFSVRGERGRFRFLRHVRTETGTEWVEGIGGPKGCHQWRSFRPDRIRRVHVKARVMPVSRVGLKAVGRAR
ncbi:DUF7246 family protein [Nocardioides ochotonae]|uniref:DUF7246 family protein n=1 Tax=Nocardioides ochotonae TaxID=2685869 RepID=UPI001CD63A47|nr:hypothetical protein [Nocardioides ochotonae]